MPLIDDVKAVLGETLRIEERARDFDAATPLFGDLPELDSMSVLAVIGALEERFDIYIEDDDISAEVFETVGRLTEFVERKQNSG